MQRPLSAPSPDTALHDRFRDAMAATCTPVSVVTTIDAGRPFGTTVSAFASLSMEPPMVLVSLDRRSDLLAAINRSWRFGLNVLGEAQADLARTFAQKGGMAKFVGVRWEERVGVPHLPGSIGFLVCEVAEVVAGGDHLIVLGDVVEAAPAPGRPLTYHARTFGTHAPVAGS